jgi:hypothetical protein
MKKLTAAVIVLTLMAGVAQANPLQKYRQDGRIEFLDIDHAMQNELNAVNNKLDNKINSALAASAAMATLPQVDGALSISMARNRHNGAFAMGYTKSINEKLMIRANAGLSNGQMVTFAVGTAIKF